MKLIGQVSLKFKGATRKTKKSSFFRFVMFFGSKNVSGWPKKIFFLKKSIFGQAPGHFKNMPKIGQSRPKIGPR